MHLFVQEFPSQEKHTYFMHDLIYMLDYRGLASNSRYLVVRTETFLLRETLIRLGMINATFLILFLKEQGDHWISDGSMSVKVGTLGRGGGKVSPLTLNNGKDKESLFTFIIYVQWKPVGDSNEGLKFDQRSQ